MARRPVKVHVRAYAVVARAVEEGAAIGARRAFKHVDCPTPEQIAESVEREVLNALCEVIDFGDEPR